VLRHREIRTLQHSQGERSYTKKTKKGYQSSKEREELECTFRPQLNERTNRIAKTQGREEESASPRVFSNLYREAEIREHK